MAFHPYPQLIRAVFNPQRFGPPLDVTPASAWPWVDHFGFGSAPTDSFALFRLAFAPAPTLNVLASPARSNSPDHNAKGTQSPHEHPKTLTRLPPLVGTRFQVLFHSPPGVLFTFPSRYSCTIGRDQSLALEGGPPGFRQGFSDPALLGYHDHPHDCTSPTGLSPRTVGRSRPLRLPQPCRTGYPRRGPTTPTPKGRFGLFPVRSPLLGESRLISLPPGTEMFQFPGSASAQERMTGHNACRVSPFGHRRITGCLLLPYAFRSLPRPSSPGRA